MPKIDKFVLMVVLVVVFASFFPSTGILYDVLSVISKIGIALLFFLHGAKLSKKALLSGITAWDRHLVVVCLTFVIFPLLSLLLKFIPENLLDANIVKGFIYLCILPATVQSSIIFTFTAKGNVALAICAASISSVLGVFISPFLVSLIIDNQVNTAEATSFLESLKDIYLQLMLPFVIGNISRKFIGVWVENHPKPLKFIDQGSILLIVYLAFGNAVSEGLWNRLDAWDFITILILSIILLLTVMFISVLISRKLHFSKEDEIAVLFCGSKKSLVNGVPMANIMFPANTVGALILPLMIFHQVQLIVSSILAKKYSESKI